MEKIVVDTNCLIQIVPHRSRYNVIWQAIRYGRYALCVSTEILNEYEEILLKLSSPTMARAVIEAILNNPTTQFVTPFYQFNLITADVDDNKFVDCAIAAQAKFIASEDNHFNVLKEIPFPRVRVIGLEDFLSDCLRQ